MLGWSIYETCDPVDKLPFMLGWTIEKKCDSKWQDVSLDSCINRVTPAFWERLVKQSKCYNLWPETHKF